MNINQIEIENFKCHKNLNEVLKSINILTGSNAAGKSSFIQAILLGAKTIKECEKKRVNTTSVFGLNLGVPSTIISEDFINKNIKLKFRVGDVQNEVILELPEDDFEISFIIKNADEIFQLKEIEESLSRLRLFYINAERKGPRIISPIEELDSFSVGYMGENTNYVISELDRVQKLNDSFRLPEDLRISQLDRFSANCEEWLKMIIPDTEIQNSIDMEKNFTAIQFKNHGEFHIPTATGFGITYVLPIIVQALAASILKNSVLIIENPEAHLHPYSQSMLGKFLTLVSENGVQIFIETHSDHMVDGCRIQAAKDKFCDKMEVLFFEKSENESIYQNIDIHPNGELEFWPEGFFDQKRLDLRELLEIKKCGM